MEPEAILTNLKGKVKGAIAATWLGLKGEILACPPEALPGETAHFLADLSSTAQGFNLGGVRLVLVELEGGSYILTPLRDGSYLILVLNQRAWIGQAIFELRKTAFWWERRGMDRFKVQGPTFKE